MMSRFKRLLRWCRKNLFPESLIAHREPKPPSPPYAPKNPDSAYCHSKPVDTITPQPIPEVSATGRPAPKHIPDGLESALPPFPIVLAYFYARQYPETEAEPFYNRFQIVRWKHFGIQRIEHWQLLADQWVLNTRHCHPPAPTPPVSHSSTRKQDKHA